jgi:bis(5'-adenosyl)-triphosphatase
VPRLTDLSADEVADLFTTVQKVQRMLARVTFKDRTGKPEDGSFNIAVQDGVEAGQTVPHVHCHIIPRQRDHDEGLTADEIYGKLAGEEGNVGGALWDRERPKPQGAFPKIEDAARHARSAEVMAKEATFYRDQMQRLENENS